MLLSGAVGVGLKSFEGGHVASQVLRLGVVFCYFSQLGYSLAIKLFTIYLVSENCSF